MDTRVDGIKLSSEVAWALSAGGAVVALESTLITHGLPWPVNLEVARGSEAAVRAVGAVPATIAMLEGEPRVGLSDAELEVLARGDLVVKAGRRDLGVCRLLGKTAGTTVSATLFLARSVGIGVMSTGGLGGVHRGAAETLDISNDLDELARADGMAVICAGAKSVLDLPATLESLETRGVLVVGYRCSEFPAFTSVSSGLPLDWRVETPQEVAELINVHRRLRVPGAVVVAQPLGSKSAVPQQVMNAAIVQALEEAGRRGVTGKALTPFLLEAVRRSTTGATLEANRDLIIDNARLAAEVAVSVARA